jgi:amidophosphoribosyltransferase
MCGIFGVWNNEKAANLTLLSLHALQHRGQEGAGISYIKKDESIETVKDKVLVSELSSKKSLKNQKSKSAIGHIRYATSGSNKKENVQPFQANFCFGDMAIAHNGNLTNQITIKEELMNNGSLLRSTSDTELILHLIAKSKKSNLIEKIKDACSFMEGAYSLLFLTKNELIGLRDPMGFRPLFLGEIDNSYILSSETCAFELLGAKFIKEILPGEMVIINDQGYETFNLLEKLEKKFCVFELIYFSRPDTIYDNESIHEIRKRMGRLLAEEYTPYADIVVPVPDSGIPAALGYAESRGIPFELGITRNHYVGRTFIDGDIGIRNLSLKMKHNPNPKVLKGKDIVLVDDSIVRGSTSKNLIKILREIGVNKIHFAVVSPPYISPCFYGIDTPNKLELLANNKTIEEIRDELDVDSLHYLSLPGLLKSAKGDFCTSCFTGEYPTKIEMKL